METEITVQVFGNRNEIQNKILKHGFKISERFTLNDNYYTSIDVSCVKQVPYAKLIESSVLVREVVCETRKYGLLVYKNKKLDENGNVLVEEKTKTGIDSVENTCKILDSAGLYNWCNISNESIVFDRDGMSFCLQCVDGLGIFLEYEEKEWHKNLSDIEKFEKLKEEIEGLGLKLGEDFSCKKPFMKLHLNNKI